jgi:S1-C subfamily serine protease
MRLIFASPLLLALAACDPARPALANSTTPPVTEIAPVAVNLNHSVVRINSTQQAWNPGQPWEKSPPNQRSALAAIVGPQRVLTTSELVTDATFLEFESTDGTRFAAAKVIAVDYEANLALLGPATESEGQLFFEKTTPFEIAAPSTIGSLLDILQVEQNGQALRTPGILQSIDVTSEFLSGHGFLTYQIKASMQNATSSYSLPVLAGGKLAGILISYDSKDQICNVASNDIVASFLERSASGTYSGFPSLGIAGANTEDKSFRQWLKLKDDQGGIYINSLRLGGAAQTAGVKKGDVLLAIDSNPIDRRGYYQHPSYGSLYWGHLVHGEKSTGDSVSLSLLRDGSPLEIKALLTRQEEAKQLVMEYHFGTAPNFMIKGGMIFQELSKPWLESFGENWQTRAPLEFLDALEHPEKYEGKVDRIIFLSGLIPTPATVGYESLRNLIVTKVNGIEIKNMKNLIDAFTDHRGERHSIEFQKNNFTVYLDAQVCEAVDAQLLKRGIPKLSACSAPLSQ